VTGSHTQAALFRHLPALAARVPWASIGNWPTPLVEARVGGRSLWIKREGDSSPIYGGNKVRTLEAWLGHAQARGARRIWAIGAYGSNHAIATVLHARTLGLDAGAIVFPQPRGAWAAENAGALVASGCRVVRLRSVVEVPFAGAAIAARQRRALVMPPGGATPIGTLGALSAVFELAEQIAGRLAPAPSAIVLPIGSTCTTAGLLAGLCLARSIGIWRWAMPRVHAVRVTPWPVTSRVVVTQLARLTLARIASLGGPDVPLAANALTIDRHELGRGYGRITPRAREAMEQCTDEWPRLDGVYSGKAAAALLRLHAHDDGPLLFWATKSQIELPGPRLADLRDAPRALVRWLG
jgi:1-aminocyclopropane-1-carboxylate deaminase/D-cysteine desulfhydrase-like pyridoxal-dependent ACC family enzyme